MRQQKDEELEQYKKEIERARAGSSASVSTKGALTLTLGPRLPLTMELRLIIKSRSLNQRSILEMARSPRWSR